MIRSLEHLEDDQHRDECSDDEIDGFHCLLALMIKCGTPRFLAQEKQSRSSLPTSCLTGLAFMLVAALTLLIPYIASPPQSVQGCLGVWLMTCCAFIRLTRVSVCEMMRKRQPLDAADAHLNSTHRHHEREPN